VDFLGGETAFALGPARLACLLGSPVLIGTPAPISSENPAMHIHIEPLFFRGQTEEDVLKGMIFALERRVLARPAHWPWMHAPPSLE